MLEGNCEYHEELGVGGRGRVRFFLHMPGIGPLISKKKGKKRKKEEDKQDNKSLLSGSL